LRLSSAALDHLLSDGGHQVGTCSRRCPTTTPWVRARS